MLFDFKYFLEVSLLFLSMMNATTVASKTVLIHKQAWQQSLSVLASYCVLTANNRVMYLCRYHCYVSDIEEITHLIPLQP